MHYESYLSIKDPQIPLATMPCVVYPLEGSEDLYYLSSLLPNTYLMGQANLWDLLVPNYHYHACLKEAAECNLVSSQSRLINHLNVYKKENL